VRDGPYVYAFQTSDVPGREGGRFSVDQVPGAGRAYERHASTSREGEGGREGGRGVGRKGKGTGEGGGEEGGR